MQSKRELLKRSNLCVILDRQCCLRHSLIRLAQDISNSGIFLVQYRDKCSSASRFYDNALKIKKTLEGTSCVFIINDRVDIAAAIGCDGVHLGQDDLPIAAARRILGPTSIIGSSCHNLAQARQAEKEGADYIGIGPIFPTPTKPGCRGIGLETLRKVTVRIRIPCFAIGGVNENNITKVKKFGARRIAVIRAVCASGNPAEAAERLDNLIK